MKSFRQGVAEYLELRRGLGFKLKRQSRILNEFVGFLEREGACHITPRLALRWATEPQQVQQVEWSARLSIARGFSVFWSSTDPANRDPTKWASAVSQATSQALPVLRYGD